MSTLTDIPADFWGQVRHQLARIESEKPDTFDAVRYILLDEAYDKIMQDIHLNGVRAFGPRDAFFSGSGGDDTLSHSLREAGWRQLWCEASYFYAMYHPGTSEILTYIEGDVRRGNHAPLSEQVSS